MANNANWGIFTELSPFHVRMHCIPCCGPELGVSLAVEGALSHVIVLCFPMNVGEVDVIIWIVRVGLHNYV